jgi:hypothetical protein
MISEIEECDQPVSAKSCVRSIQRGPSDNTPALDRVDNTKGYVKGSVLVTSSRANVLKRDAEEWELRAIADYTRSAMTVKEGAA